MENEVTTTGCNNLNILSKSDKNIKKAIQPEFIYYGSQHLYTYKNTEFSDSFSLLLLERNVLQKYAISSRYLSEENGINYCIATNVPRYKSWYKVLNINTSTAEIEEIIKESDSIIRQRGRLIRALNSFDTIYKPLYRQRKVSCLFGTLTNVPDAKFTIRIFLKHLKTVFKRKGINLLSYIWCSEVKFKYNTSGAQLPIHWHYHFVLAIERIDVSGSSMPECLSSSYLSSLWGQRAQIRFIKGGNACLNYCSKYISKGSENGIVLGVRRYGASRNITSKK